MNAKPGSLACEDLYGVIVPRNDNLTILREYTCGCIVYRSDDGREPEEKGLFCPSRVGPVMENTPGGHRQTLVKGQETQAGLFS